MKKYQLEPKTFIKDYDGQNLLSKLVVPKLCFVEPQGSIRKLQGFQKTESQHNMT